MARWQDDSITQLRGIGDPDLNFSEASGRRAVSGAHRLHGLPLAAIGGSPQSPVLRATDGVAGIPEVSRDAAVTRVLEHPGLFPVLDLPPDLGPKLKVVSPIVDRP